MLQAVMEKFVKSGMRFNKLKNRNKNGLSSPEVLIHSNFSMKPNFKENQAKLS